MTILKIKKKKCFTTCLEDAFFEKQQGEGGMSN